MSQQETLNQVRLEIHGILGLYRDQGLGFRDGKSKGTYYNGVI